jgi:pimeloyl-ACP methyl ester carboxylesterase
MAESFRSVFVTAQDGLRLHARDYGDRAWSALPVVCLAGLTRNSQDFDRVATALSTEGERPRRVLALDYRGRGLSGRDADWQRYDVRIEAEDTLAVLAALGVGEAVFLGTSRGGLVSMAVAAMRPGVLKGVVLNDIGPVIEGRGLIRIRSYVGKLAPPRSLPEAADLLRKVSDQQFPALSADDWLELAGGSWMEKDGKLVSSYDPALMKGLEKMDLEAPLPQLWGLFEGLKDLPVLAIRGENSDLLAPETFAEMAKRHPGLSRWTVPGQGHAPLLRDRPTIERIARFVEEVEAGKAAPEAGIAAAA